MIRNPSNCSASATPAMTCPVSSLIKNCTYGGLTTNSSPVMANGTVWTFGNINGTNNADSGTELVNWRTMTNLIAAAYGMLPDGSTLFTTWNGPTNVLYIVDPTGAFTNRIGTFSP